MATKLKDIAVKTGVYIDQSGIEKGRYENVGVLMQGNDGNEFIILNRTFNPAGVPVSPGKDTVILSMFDPKQANAQPQQAQYPQAGAAQGGYPQQPMQPPQGQYTNPNGTPMTPQQVQAARQAPQTPPPHHY